MNCTETDCYRDHYARGMCHLHYQRARRRDRLPALWKNEQSIDEVNVYFAVDGRRPVLTSREREEAVRRVHARRWSDSRIADLLGVSDRTVLRIRGRLGLTAWPKSEQVPA